jgi:hypothetical protein
MRIPNQIPGCNPLLVIPVIEEGIKMEKLNLEANKLLGNELTSLEIEKRITEAQILLSVLRMDLGGFA